MNIASPNQTRTISINLLIGGFAGAVAKTTVAPLERLRILRQTGASTTNMLGTLTKIVENEGILGLWRGNFINVVRIIPARGVLFASNDVYKIILKDIFPTTDDPEKTPFWMLFSSGGLAGMTAIVATYPLDVARTRLAGRYVTGKNVWSANTTSMTMCLRKMLKEEGLRSWYRGMGPTLFGALPYEGIKFSVYGFLTSHYFDKSSISGKLISGAISGCAAGLVMFPNDTVRKLLQIRVPSFGGPPFTSAFNCWKRTYQAEGIGRFYRGVIPYMLRIAPSSAIQFAVYETLKVIVIRD